MADINTATAFNSLMLLAIQEKIKTEIPEIKWVDQDFGQLEIYEERPAVQFPCLLVDFIDTDFDQQGDKVQWAKQMIQFKLGFNPYTSASSATPAKQQQQALAFYEIEKLLYQVFQQWDGNEICQPMIRTKTITQQREDTYRVRIILFTTSYDDDTARDYTAVERPPITLDLGLLPE